MADATAQQKNIQFTPGPVRIAEPDAAALAIPSPAQTRGAVQVAVPNQALQEVIAQRQRATTHVYKTLNVIQADLKAFFPKVTDTLPAKINGVLLNPDGAPA